MRFGRPVQLNPARAVKYTVRDGILGIEKSACQTVFFREPSRPRLRIGKHLQAQQLPGSVGHVLHRQRRQQHAQHPRNHVHAGHANQTDHSAG